MQIDNPAFDYDTKEHQYSDYRRTDPRIEAYVHAALGDARTVLNVGAGAGSYEPADRYVVAVEPSAVMRMQRLEQNRAPAINATADALPFDDDSFDASMATVTIHHWPAIAKGLKEMRRIARRGVVVMTFDPDALHDFWNAEYFPQVVAVEQKRYPSIDYIVKCLGGNCEVQRIPVPFDCTDGFQEAFYGRPEAFLQKEVRQSQSAWGFVDEATAQSYVDALAADLASGKWDMKYGKHRHMKEFTCALRLIVAHPIILTKVL